MSEDNKIFSKIDSVLKLHAIKNEFKSSKFMDFLHYITEKQLSNPKVIDIIYENKKLLFDNFKFFIKNPSKLKANKDNLTKLFVNVLRKTNKD